MAHICVSKQTTIGSNNGLSPGRRQAIIYTNAKILLIGPLGTNISENSNIFIQENAFANVVCEMAAIWLQCVNYRIWMWRLINTDEGSDQPLIMIWYITDWTNSPIQLKWGLTWLNSKHRKKIFHVIYLIFSIQMFRLMQNNICATFDYNQCRY